MNSTPIVFAKLAALYKEVKARPRNVSSSEMHGYLERYIPLGNELRSLLPELYSDLPRRRLRLSGLVYSDDYKQLIRDLEYIFEVRANSELKQELATDTPKRPRRVFISHGRSADWREVQSYLEKDLNIDTLELAQAPNRGRTVLQKLSDESDKCCFAVVVMTADDQVDGGPPRARENVLHEIGFFQGKLGLENVCLLHEEGTNMPSNIHGLVYVPFPKGLVSAGFSVLAREVGAALRKLE